MILFASDNNSGAHPRILEALQRVNHGRVSSYGEDHWTAEATEMLRTQFGATARPWFVFLGTAANVLGLKSMIRSHEAVICPDTAHINTDECGAPETIIGGKLVVVPSHAGKIDLEECRRKLVLREAVHHPYPKVLSITQSTEYGTLYTIEELKNISAFCRENGLWLHMDGARLCNAAAALGVGLKEITADVGVDVLSFGGTKNGLISGEAVIFFNDDIGHDFKYVRKQFMQLGSKMRFMAAPFTEYLKDGLWLENATHANNMAQRLAKGLKGLDHVDFVYPVEVNALFVRMPQKALDALAKNFYFYIIDPFDQEGFAPGRPMIRLMTSFDTTEAEVDALIDAVRALKDVR